MTGVLSRHPIPRYAAVRPDPVTHVGTYLDAALGEIGTHCMYIQGGGAGFIGIALEDSVLVNSHVWSTPVLRTGVCNVDWNHGYVPPLTHVKVSAEGTLEVSDTRNIAFTLNMLDERRVELFVRSHMPAEAPAVAAAAATTAQKTIPDAMVLLIKGALTVNDFTRQWSNTYPSNADKNIYRNLYNQRKGWERMVEHCQAGDRWQVPPAATYNYAPRIPSAFRLTAKTNTDPLDIKNFKTINPPDIICDSNGNVLTSSGKLLHRIPPGIVKLKTDMLMFMRRDITATLNKYVLFNCDGNCTEQEVRNAPFALELPPAVYDWIHSKSHTNDLTKLRAEYIENGLPEDYLSKEIEQPGYIATGAAV